MQPVSAASSDSFRLVLSQMGAPTRLILPVINAIPHAMHAASHIHTSMIRHANAQPVISHGQPGTMRALAQAATSILIKLRPFLTPAIEQPEQAISDSSIGVPEWAQPEKTAISCSL
ncbi:hypothetical protein TARUN_10344 [Trichoderma arundinaceum]|uniref:Uncharacterized protein n=1 Tax=Trichoderma arundinaceum TaxID=490622 RepID=A0A395N7B8_TRIAR|nr:hypothetical protein TARUN_10344 [Trichoderma arundinaceum]